MTQKLVKYARKAPPPVASADLLHITDSEQYELLRPAIEAAEADRDFEHAANTKTAYAEEWTKFEAWCLSKRLSALPAVPHAVALYVAEMASKGRRPSGLGVAVAAIGYKHDKAGYDAPTRHGLVKTEMKMIRRRYGTAPAQKSPLTVEHLRQMVEATPSGLVGVRDRALMLVGFAGAFRRSEIAQLRRPDVDFNKKGLNALVRRSKGDQEGKGLLKAIPQGSETTCPCSAMEEWLDATKGKVGKASPVFVEVDRWDNIVPRKVGEDELSGMAIAILVKKYVQKIGLEPEKYSGHSLRAGLITASAEAGRSLDEICELTGHKNIKTLLLYIRSAQRFERAASRGLL